MRVLVTGATGKVGNAVTRALATAGFEVAALVRNAGRARSVVPEGVDLIVGDVTDPRGLEEAFSSAELVFNAMGLPEQWLRDEALFEQVNVVGSANVVRAARRVGVRRVVHTSTIDVFHAEPGARFDESQLADYPKGTAYERSKQRAEQAVLEAAGDEVEVVIVNPATVYGLGPAGPASMEHRMFARVVRGLLPIVPPGGFGLVFTEGLADAQVRAADRGRPGERYIVCDGHATMADLAALVVRIAGRGRVPRTLPRSAAAALAAAGEAIARVTKRPPPLARGQLAFLSWNAVPDSTKAERELGWSPTPLEEGVRRTLESLGLISSD